MHTHVVTTCREANISGLDLSKEVIFRDIRGPNQGRSHEFIDLDLSGSIIDDIETVDIRVYHGILCMNMCTYIQYSVMVYLP